MAELPEETNQRLFRMTTLSPRVRSVISSEMYFIDTDKDEVNNETVQQEAFLCLTEDLSEIGVYWAVDNADIYTNTYTLDQVLDVLAYILPNTLYTKMRNNDTLVTAIRSLVQGDITDGDILISYLSFLGGDETHPPFDASLTEACAFVMENIRSTEVFGDYLVSLLGKYDAERQTKITHLTSPKEYHTLVTSLIARVCDCSNVLLTQKVITEEEQNILIRKIKLFTQYLSQSDRIEDFSFVLLTTPSRLAPEELPLYKSKVDSFLTGCRLSLEYYTHRQKDVAFIDLCGIISFLYGRSVSESLFDKKINTLKSQVKEKGDLIDKIAAAIRGLYEVKGE